MHCTISGAEICHLTRLSRYHIAGLTSQAVATSAALPNRLRTATYSYPIVLAKELKELESDVCCKSEEFGGDT